MEAIGLALGVAPLIIEILKTYPQPVHALAALRDENSSEMLFIFYTNLQYELSMLNLTLRQLISDLPISSELEEALTEESILDPAIWKSPPASLADSLHQRLGPCMEPFKTIMELALRLMAKVVDNKDILPFLAPEQVRRYNDTPYGKLEVLLKTELTAKKRLKLGWKKKELKAILKGITQCNKKLNTMLSRTSEHRASQPLSRSSYASRPIPHPRLLEKLNSFRNAFEKACCTCETNKHELRLALAGTAKLGDHVRMDMIMNTSKNDGEWHWAGGAIHIHLESSSSPSITGAPPNHIDSKRHRRSSSNLSGSTIAGSPGSDTGFKLTDLVPPTMPLGDASSKEYGRGDMQCSSCRTHLSQLNQKVMFTDVCLVLKQGQKLRKASQLIFCQDDLWHKGTTTSIEIDKSSPGLSLGHHLQNTSMSMKDRKITQVRLAQSVLHIPWTGQDLNKESIVFHSTYDKPFATLVLNQTTEPSLLSSDSPKINLSTAEDKPYNNEILAALAIMLLEMELGKRIEDLRNDEDIAEDDPSQFITNFWTLIRVLKEHEHNMYSRPYEAINACIKCDFGDGSPRLEDPVFLQNIYDRVVVPLEQELYSGFKYNIPYLEESNAKINRGKTLDEPAKTIPVRQQTLTHRRSVKISIPALFDVSEEDMSPAKIV